jgi:hypothetical protein
MNRLLLLALLLVGCSSGADFLRDRADAVQAALKPSEPVVVVWCSRSNPDCAHHHGYYYPATGLKPATIHIATQWLWEPEIYVKGVIAHEMIHHILAVRGIKPGQLPHGREFQDERERVAKLLDIPVWAIPNGRRIDKLDATRDIAELEAWLEANRPHGAGYWADPMTAGWPTQAYDPDED